MGESKQEKSRFLIICLQHAHIELLGILAFVSKYENYCTLYKQERSLPKLTGMGHKLYA